MNKIRNSEEPEFTRQYPDVLLSEIEVVTRSGESFVERASHPKGHKKNPMSNLQLVDLPVGDMCRIN